MILCIETATNICSVALCDKTGLVSSRESEDLKSHGSMLTVFIEQVLKDSSLKASDLEAVAVSRGPGSYTGLRIGVSVAKGIAYAASIPLISIDTTFLMFAGVIHYTELPFTIDKNTLFCPMLDARRMEVYYAIYNANGQEIKEISAEIIDESSFSHLSTANKLVFFGNGASKCREVLKTKNVCFLDDFRISAAYMQLPAYEAFNKNKFEDVAYFEPLYLKDFITTTPRKNILGI